MLQTDFLTPQCTWQKTASPVPHELHFEVLSIFQLDPHTVPICNTWTLAFDLIVKKNSSFFGCLPDISFNTVLQTAITSCLKMPISVLIPLSLEALSKYSVAINSHSECVTLRLSISKFLSYMTSLALSFSPGNERLHQLITYSNSMMSVF